MIRLDIPTSFALLVLASCAPAIDAPSPIAPSMRSDADAGATCASGSGCVRPSVCVTGRSAAQFQRQLVPPAVMTPGQRAGVSVTFANCSGTDWDAGYALEPAHGTDVPGWNAAHLALPSRVPAGSEVTVAFDVTAPSNDGTFAFSWAITPPSGVALEAPSTPFAVDVRASADCSVAGPPVRSSYDAPPQFVATGALAHATLRLANCSTTPWLRADGVYLAALDGSAAAAFGASRVELPGDVASGDSIAVELDLMVPATQGAYRLAWQLTRGTEALDAPTPDLALTALEAADCTGAGPPSRFVREAPPDVLTPGQTATVSATFANCSGATWDSGNALVAGPGTLGTTWGVDRAALPLAVGSGYAIATAFDVHAPATPGMYPYRWSIADGTTVLDEPSPLHQVTVRCVPMCTGHDCGADGCGGSCGECSDGATCDGANCRAPLVSCGALQWWNARKTSVTHPSWEDTDLGVRASTPIQLRHASRLVAHGVYGWGFVPTFTDLVTGAEFRFLHLRPSMQNATDVGRVYPAGFIVGISGGDSYDTGYPTYSTGAHLCVQTPGDYDADFPRGVDACM